MKVAIISANGEEEVAKLYHFCIPKLRKRVPGGAWMDPRMVPKSIQNRLFWWSKASELQHLISGVPGGGSRTPFHSTNNQKLKQQLMKKGSDSKYSVLVFERHGGGSALCAYRYPPPCPQGTRWCGHRVLDSGLRCSGAPEGGRGTPGWILVRDPPLGLLTPA